MSTWKESVWENSDWGAENCGEIFFYIFMVLLSCLLARAILFRRLSSHLEEERRQRKRSEKNANVTEALPKKQDTLETPTTGNIDLNDSLQGTTDVDRICCIMEMDGFSFEGHFLVREIGWIDMSSNRRGSVRFNLRHKKHLLTQGDQWRNKTMAEMHGLTFEPMPGEPTIPLRQLNSKIRQIYSECRTGDRDIVACKGKNYVRYILKRLGIPLSKHELLTSQKLRIPKIQSSEGCAVDRKDVDCKDFIRKKFHQESLDIRNFNPEHLNVPKYDKIRNLYANVSCGYHARNLPCPLGKVTAMKQWLRNRYD